MHCSPGLSCIDHVTDHVAADISNSMPPAGDTRARKLIGLTGFMGSGKTTIGRLLARHLGWRFVDLDTLIEERAGLSIPAIFERLGELAFREMEYDALGRSLGEAAESGK